jgi:acyl-CoA reductase-like NAD-dependent aldehyde dehydrogenase
MSQGVAVLQTSQRSGTVAAAGSAPCLVAGEPHEDGPPFEVRSPFDGVTVTRAFRAPPALVDRAVLAARAAAGPMAAMPGHERARRLIAVADAIAKDAEGIATLLARETGKTIRECRVELARSEGVVRLCAEEATRIAGRHIPLDASRLGADRLAVSRRFPMGVVALIVPFNAPVNLACHKVGPALAAGNALVLKAPPEAAGTVTRLFGHLLAAGFPAGAVNLLHGDAATGQALVSHPDVDFISFTGSLRGGRMVKASAGMRPCILELGGLGPTVVHHDADLERAAESCTAAGYRLAGQSCASVQNVFVHESVAARFEALLLARVVALRPGDPLDPQSDLGPVVNEAAAERIVASVAEAVSQGARLLAGGGRNGAMVGPTLLADAAHGSRAVCEEIFGPVVLLHRYTEIARVFDWVNASGFGINFGLFTGSIDVALDAHRSVIAGAVIVNGSSTYRPDQMPYGGDRNSGYGRESPADTVRAMTRERLLVFS